jgi:hypothetical protein
MRRLVLLIGLSMFGMIWFMPSPAYANDQTIVQVTIDKCFRVEIHGGPIEWSDAYGNKPDFHDFETGWTDDFSVSVRVWANCKWKLEIQGTAGPKFLATPGAWQDKPVGDIQWHDGEVSGFHSLTQSPVYVNKGDVPVGEYIPVSVTFHVLLHWATDSPGTYTYGDSVADTGVMFTASSQ